MEFGTKDSADELWLVRTVRNEILGPFASEELKHRITQQQFSSDDEICKANHYWIFLREKSEVKAHLGLEIAQHFYRDDSEQSEDLEPTQTQIGESEGLPELDSEALNSEETSLIRSRALRETPAPSARFKPLSEEKFSRREAGKGAPPATLRQWGQDLWGKEPRSGKTDGTVFYRALAGVMAVVAGGLVYWVLRLLEARPR